jgi:hypothetical protein
MKVRVGYMHRLERKGKPFFTRTRFVIAVRLIPKFAQNIMLKSANVKQRMNMVLIAPILFEPKCTINYVKSARIALTVKLYY